MKALLAFAVLATGSPAIAAAASADEPGAGRERRICTQIQRYGGSRIAYQRVCLTAAEWRERLGPDWRQRLAGNTPNEDLDALDVRTREWSNIDGFYGTTPNNSTPGAPR